MAKVPCFNLDDRNRMSLEEPPAVAQDEDVRAGTIGGILSSEDRIQVRLSDESWT